MKKVRIPQAVLDEARSFLENAGSLGNEGTGMLAATVSRDIGSVTKFVGPDQSATPVGVGCSVEVTERGKLDLATSLELDEVYISRIHSHPGEAFHSSVDDRNRALTAEGSLSIVVPYFGLGLRRGLSACAIFVHRYGRWVELSSSEVNEIFEVIDGRSTG